jgi:hypothetical protein
LMWMHAWFLRFSHSRLNWKLFMLWSVSLCS